MYFCSSIGSINYFDFSVGVVEYLLPLAFDAMRGTAANTKHFEKDVRRFLV